MSNNEEHLNEKPVIKKEMSRRQFLTYTLGGTGGFLVALPLIPMIRFTVDPLLQPKAAGEWVKVVEENKITDVPQSFSFQKHQVDGWYESNPSFSAWIARDSQGKIFALSPVCKHLGCTIDWGTDASNPNIYVCPCHNAHYSKDGDNLTVAPAPLDEYEVKIEEGFVYLAQTKPNSRV